MPTPLLSVCLITYNHEKYIRQAIEGVLMQKVNFDWELIIADDFSTDGTRAILQEYQQQHPNHIRLILQEKNVGPERNWLDLIETPKSKYIAYFEGDDFWIDEKKLQKQVDFLETNTNCSFCFHKAYKVLGEKTEYHDTYPKSVKKSVLTESDFFEIPTIPTASIVYRNGVRIPKLSHSHGDFLLYCALLSIGLAGFIDEKMSVYRLHEKGVSSKYNENWYLERRINELLVEAKYSQFSRKVSQEIEKTLVKIIIDYLNQNRGVLHFRQKIHYFRVLIQLKKFFNLTSKDYIKLFKSLLS